MTLPADILGLAPSIAAGGQEPPHDKVLRRDIGRLVNVGPGAALECLDRTLSGGHVGTALRWLESTGALGVWLPEVQALVDFHESSPCHHKDLWAHTVEVVERTPAEADLRWVALLHDIGKIATRSIDGRGHISFYGHERLGAWLAEGITARLGMPSTRSARIAFIVEHHARVNAYEPSWTDRAVRRLIRDAGVHLDDMLRFSSADYTTKRRKQASKIRSQLEQLQTRIALQQQDAATPPVLPPGMGHALCEGLALAPGPHIGEAITWLEGEIEHGRLPSGQGLDTYVEAIRARSD